MIEITGENQRFSDKTIGEIIADRIARDEASEAKSTPTAPTTVATVYSSKKADDPPEFVPEQEPLRVEIDWYPYAKIMHWIRKAGGIEVSGWGKVVIEGTTMRVVDAFLVKQTNTAGETDIDAGDLARVLYQTKDRPGTMNFWWHSHHNMSAYFSSTDYANIKSHGSNGWLLSTVFNNREEQQTSLYVAKPVQIFLDKLPLKVCRPAITAESQAILDKQYDEKVSVAHSGPVVIHSPGHYHGYGGAWRDPGMPEPGAEQWEWDLYLEEKYPHMYGKITSDDGPVTAPLRRPTKRERKLIKQAAKQGKTLTWDPGSNSMVLK